MKRALDKSDCDRSSTELMVTSRIQQTDDRRCKSGFT
jgi:hypothetical protein